MALARDCLWSVEGTFPQSLPFTSGKLFLPLDFFNAEILERDCSRIVKQLLPAISYCAEKEMYAIAIAGICLNRTMVFDWLGAINI